MENLLGESPKFRISEWQKQDSENIYTLKRNTAWNEDKKKETLTKGTIEKGHYKPGIGKPPNELIDFEKLRHKDIGVVSFINPKLWKKAKWRGTAYLTTKKTKYPPLIALGFKNEEAAKKYLGAG